MNTRTPGMLELYFDRAASCWNLVAQNPYHRVATVSETPTPVPEADARHLAACWNAIEAIGGDPGVVGEMAAVLGEAIAYVGATGITGDMPPKEESERVYELLRPICNKIRGLNS